MVVFQSPGGARQALAVALEASAAAIAAVAELEQQERRAAEICADASSILKAFADEEAWAQSEAAAQLKTWLADGGDKPGAAAVDQETLARKHQAEANHAAATLMHETVKADLETARHRAREADDAVQVAAAAVSLSEVERVAGEIEQVQARLAELRRKISGAATLPISGKVRALLDEVSMSPRGPLVNLAPPELRTLHAQAADAWATFQTALRANPGVKL